jgi:hypothetical protein
MVMAQQLNEHEAKVIIGMYLAGRCQGYIARQIGRSRTSIHNLLVQHNIPLRINKHAYIPVDPTPEEIAKETSEIRKNWRKGEAEERARIIPYEFPTTCNMLGVE